MLSFNEYKERFTDFVEPSMARGGQKVVYKANHPAYGDVVVKVLFNQDERAKREIAIVEENSFNAVPKILETEDVLYEGNITKVIVEEYVSGECLRDVIKSGRRFNLREAADFLEHSLKFLVEISAKGIVHRDIKPENIILVGDRPVFLDFGIARILGANSLTKTGVMGPNTPGYAPPELFTGMKNRIDGRSDLFSIGVVTYELIVGVNPFAQNARSPFQVYQNTITITPVSHCMNGDSQSQFMGLLSALMSKQISARPRNAQQALSWLENARLTFDEGAME